MGSNLGAKSGAGKTTTGELHDKHDVRESALLSFVAPAPYRRRCTNNPSQLPVSVADFKSADPATCALFNVLLRTGAMQYNDNGSGQIYERPLIDISHLGVLLYGNNPSAAQWVDLKFIDGIISAQKTTGRKLARLHTFLRNIDVITAVVDGAVYVFGKLSLLTKPFTIENAPYVALTEQLGGTPLYRVLCPQVPAVSGNYLVRDTDVRVTGTAAMTSSIPALHNSEEYIPEIVWGKPGVVRAQGGDQFIFPVVVTRRKIDIRRYLLSCNRLYLDSAVSFTWGSDASSALSGGVQSGFIDTLARNNGVDTLQVYVPTGAKDPFMDGSYDLAGYESGKIRGQIAGMTPNPCKSWVGNTLRGDHIKYLKVLLVTTRRTTQRDTLVPWYFEDYVWCRHHAIPLLTTFKNVFSGPRMAQAAWTHADLQHIDPQWFASTCVPMDLAGVAVQFADERSLDKQHIVSYADLYNLFDEAREHNKNLYGLIKRADDQCEGFNLSDMGAKHDDLHDPWTLASKGRI